MSTVSARIGLSTERIKLVLFALFGVAFLGLAVPAFVEPMTFWTGIVLGDYIYPSHELHHFVLGSIITVLLLGVLAQVLRPKRRVGALHTSVAIWIVLTIVLTIGGDFSPIFLVLLGLLLGMALTHPAGTEQLPSRTRLDRRMAVLAAITTFGAIAVAGMELSAHLAGGDAHVGFGHYTFMAITWLSIAALSVYGSFRGIGWRFPTYAAAFFLVVIGLASIAFPGAEQGSSLGVGLGIAVVLWAVLFIVVAERGDELFARLQS